jgi:hypothetical protein
MDKPNLDPVLLAAAWIAGIAAAVASYSALFELAVHTGWSPRAAWLFPLTVDAYAVAALRVWLGKHTASQAARQRARRNAVLAIAASMAGNAALHAALAGDYRITWPVVVAVSAVPPVTLGLVSHLLALRSMPEPAGEQLEPLPEPSPAELQEMSKAEAIRIALAHTDGAVLAAQRWLAARGVKVDRAYAHDVRRGVRGKRRRHRPAPVLAAAPEPEEAAA